MISPPHQPRHLLLAWGVSFSIHAIVLASALAMLHDLPHLQPPTYRMEFLITDPTSALDAAASHAAPTATEHPSPTVLSHSTSTSTASTRVIEQHPLTETSIIQPTVNPVTPPAVEQRETSPAATANDSMSVKSPTPIERQNETPPPVSESDRPATVDSFQPVERPVMTTATTGEEPMTKRLHEDVPHASPAPSEISQHAAETVGSLSSDSASQLSSSAIDHFPSSQSTDRSSVTSSHTNVHSPMTTPQRTAMTDHPSIMRTTLATPDYGWLKDLLKRRIMSLQSYPRLARMQGWEGIVVVRATISHDGSLLDAVVTKSSGYAALDEDALKLLQRACPIILQHDLGQSHIDVTVPVHYRLE